MSLYMNITNIIWDYDSANVSGYVSNAVTKRVLPFTIDAAETSSFDVANSLWASVAAAGAPAIESS
jgi:hypothetical protein